MQFTQTHISGAWVQGHEWQAGRRHCGQRGLIVKAQITSNVLVRAPPLHIWPKMSRHMKGDLYEGHQFSVTMKESARQGHHLYITRSKKTPATSSPLCFRGPPKIGRERPSGVGARQHGNMAFFFLTGYCVFFTGMGGAWKTIHRELGARWGCVQYPLITRDSLISPRFGCAQ